MSRPAVIQRDRGWRKIKRAVDELGKSDIHVGVLGNAGQYDERTTTVEVAVWNEFGTETVPARPFMRRTADENERKVAVLGQGFVGKVIDGTITPKNALHQIGLWFAAQIVRTINKSSGWAVPNAPSTIQAKGSSHPLVDTSHLRKNISHVIVGKGSNRS